MYSPTNIATSASGASRFANVAQDVNGARAWTVYFCAMAALSVAVHALAPFTTWATFANLLAPLALVAMFVGEYTLRYRLHPEFERASLKDMVRAYSRRAEPTAPPTGRPLP